jgi:hypothetical protein
VHVNSVRLGYAVRVAVCLAFVFYLYGVRFAPYRELPFEDVENTVRAINTGHPFQLLWPGANGERPIVKRMSAVNGDYGIQLIVSAVGSAGRTIFGPSFQLRTQVARVIVVLLFVITAAIIVLPPVPLLVAIGGVLALWALFLWGTFVISDARHWGVTYAAVVGAVFAGTVLSAWSRSRVVVLVLLAVLIAYAQLLRQEAAPTAYALGLALIAGAAVTWVAARRRPAPPEAGLRSRWLPWRAMAGGLLLIVATAGIVPLERWCFSVAWGTPYRETAIAEHGVGFPLYLSLGYVSNPFNIGWRDPIGQVHASLITPGVGFDDPEFQPILLHEYEHIVVSRPWLFLRNVVAKIVRVHQLSNEPSGPATTGSTVNQSAPLVYAYRAMPWILAGTLALMAWRGTADGMVVWFSLAALAVGASVGPIVVFPEYLGGLQGSIVALALVLPAVAFGSMRDASHQPDGTAFGRRVLAGYAVVMMIGAATVAAFTGVQAWRYRGVMEATAMADPVTAIGSQQFRYAHVFNDLTTAQQGRLVARLTASADPSVAAKADETLGDSTLFKAIVAVRSASQVHAIVWMGRGFVPPMPRLFQGATHASVLICEGCPSSTTVNDTQPGLTWTMINDLEWQGRYRMFSFPMSAPMKTAGFFRVTAERASALDLHLPTWMVTQLIGSARLNF